MSLIPAFFGRLSTNLFDPFSLDVWDPFQGFPFCNNDNNSLTPLRRGWDSETSAFAGTRVDWKETPEAYDFTVDLQGVKEEMKVEVEVEVEVEEGRILQISEQRSKDKEEKSDRWHRLERSIGGFLRRFRLPVNPKADLVQASMENGVMTMTNPKEEVKKLEVKAIEISG